MNVSIISKQVESNAKTLYQLKKSIINYLGLKNYEGQTLTNTHAPNNIYPKVWGKYFQKYNIYPPRKESFVLIISLWQIHYVKISGSTRGE